jgi:HlyD family secretion protein/adhesin transport system membrane fusion protein
MMGRTATADQLRYIGQAELLEEGAASRFAGWIAVLGGIGVICAVAWAAWVQVAETTQSSGQVLPAGAIRAVQHLEGGIVSDLVVQEGDLVKAGSPILKFAEAQTLAEFDQLRAREAGLLLRVERLKAFVERRQPDFSQVGVAYRDLAADQLNMFRAQEDARISEIQVLNGTLAERQAEWRQIDSQLADLRAELGYATETVSARDQLVAKGLASRMLLLDNQREQSRLAGELASLEANSQRAQDAVATARTRLVEAQAKLDADASNEMNTAAAELAQVREMVRKQQDRVDRLVVTAPVDGIVKSLKVKTVGGVVQPGALIAEIVPVSEELVAEVKVNTRDVGHLRPGLPVFVRVQAFDTSRYGGIEGTLKQVSASTFEDGEGKPPYYKAIVTLSRAYVGSDRTQNQIMPGMALQADIRTGTRSVLQYLIKPVNAALSSAFNER